MFKIEYPFKNEILACGAQQQANFCLTKKNCAFVVNDLGDLNEDSSFQRYQEEIEQLKIKLKLEPKVISHDLHPDYPSTRYAQGLSQSRKKLRFISVQHHKAHLASCIGENAISGRIMGVVFDTGALGEDGQTWGGEFFVGDLEGLRRIAHLKYAGITDGTSSMARLFDTACTLIGLRERIDYEGQGVAELERIVNRSSHVANKIYEFTLERNKDAFLIATESVFKDITQDLEKNISKSIISAAFHNTIVEIIRQLCHKISQKEKVKDIILTGSVFQNKVLFNRAKAVLITDGFRVITHKHFAYNDSNISFGQAVLADALLRH